MKKSSKKKVIKHLKGDIKTFKREASEDKEMIKSLSKSGNGKKKDNKRSKKSHEKRETKAKERREHKKSSPKAPRAKKKVERVMREYKSGKLHSGSKRGPKVSNPKQAIAIALSEARRVGKKKKQRK